MKWGLSRRDIPTIAQRFSVGFLCALARLCLGPVLCVMILGLAGCHQTPSPRFEPLSATGFPLNSGETSPETAPVTNGGAFSATNTATQSWTNVLQEGDTLSINFLYSTNFNAVQKVGLDGLINLDQVGQVKAAGRTVTNLQAELTRLYQPYVKEDSITVRLTAAAASVYISGAVVRPGRVAMERPMTALEGIMEAGGFDPSRARMKVVIVSRLENGQQRTYRLNLKRALEGRDAKPFYLQPFDILYVPTKTINF